MTAEAAEILGILGITACAFCAPFAWILGNTDMKEIQAGRMDPEGEQLTNIGRILGMVGTGLMVFSFCIVVPIYFFMAFAAIQQQ